jgi:hypothetical protein
MNTRLQIQETPCNLKNSKLTDKSGDLDKHTAIWIPRSNQQGCMDTASHEN